MVVEMVKLVVETAETLILVVRTVKRILVVGVEQALVVADRV
jgi:hypothetical protein